ncbi:hypothetical protein ACFO0N_05965 [Halobium salinum]|uniref:DUF7845 domain-containing protein n=1 Tax=Halobium salinum TaxID=1364940 RepID=A0ABD5P9F5_9EURY|nr:winged helix-turn-helix domain-containing protein [Halobium salinum]
MWGIICHFGPKEVVEVTVELFSTTQCHEFDVHFIFTEYGLKPYYWMDSIRKEYDGWQTEGKPTAQMSFNGHDYILCYDYDKGGLDPWEHESYHLQSVPEFRFYFARKDALWNGGRPDSKGARKGAAGTITVRPRWPNLTSNGNRVSVPDLGQPYIDAQVQASNIPHDQYHELLRHIMAAFGGSTSYFSEPHEMSNIGDAAVYLRIDSEESGSLYAADGPIARSHNLLEADRSGYRKHVEDHRKRPGYYVTTTITDERAADLVRGHKFGKEVKHYYPEHPKKFEPDDPLYHPKLEISYQTSVTDETVYWDDLEDLTRELEETLFNIMDWSGLSIRGGSHLVSDQYFDASAEHRRSLRITDCPLPEVENEQEMRVMRLWRDMTDSDEQLVDHLLTDGGQQSMQGAAESIDCSYRTIRRSVQRLEGLVEQTYGNLEIASKHQQQLMLKRLRAAKNRFEQTMEQTVMEVADAASDQQRSAWSKVRAEYDITVKEDTGDCRKLLEIGYQPKDSEEAREVLNEIRLRYQETFGFNSTHGIHARVTYLSGQSRRFRSLDQKVTPMRRGGDRTRDYREKVEQIDWAEHGYSPAD